MAIVTFFAPELWDAIETMAYFLALEKVCDVRLATRCEGGDERAEHPWILQRTRLFGGIELVPYDGTPQHSDILVFYLVRNGRVSDRFDGWRARAKSVVYLSPTEGPLTWRDWLRETVRSFPHYLGARRIRFTPYLHPKFIANSEWLKASFAPVQVDAPRQWRLGFLGNREPPERTVRLAQCKGAIAGAESRVNWREYGGWETIEPRGLVPMEYMQALSDLDFCLSPPGWGLQWTHRTIEALVRGAIPVLEDPQAHGLDLRDGENCIIAKSDDWGSAVRRALNYAEADVRRMRGNVVALRESQLLPHKAIDRFRSELLA